MHTSAGAAYGHDDDAPELCACSSLRRSKVKEICSHVNETISQVAGQFGFLTYYVTKQKSKLTHDHIPGSSVNAVFPLNFETWPCLTESDISQGSKLFEARWRRNGRQNSEGRSGLEEATHTESILCDPPEGH